MTGSVQTAYHAPGAPPPGASDRNSPDYDPTYDPKSPYYIDRTGTSDTSQEVQEQAEQQVDQDIDQANWWEIWKQFTRNSEINEQFNQDMSAQANQLAQGLQTRPGPALSCTNYLSTEHPTLQTMVTEGVDPDQVGEMGEMYVEAGNQMSGFQGDVASAINNSQTDWQGTAGDSARQFMADIGNWVGKAGQSAQLAGTQTGIQASALAEAKNSMPEPVPFDLKAANQDLATTTDPIELATKATQYMNDYRASQAAHEEAARVVGTYDGALGSSATMPAFATPPTMSGGGTDDPGKPDDGKKVQNPGDSDVTVSGGDDRGASTFNQNPGGGNGSTNPPQLGGGNPGTTGNGGGNGGGTTPGTPQIPIPPGGGNGTTNPSQYPPPSGPGHLPGLNGPNGGGGGGAGNGSTNGGLNGMTPLGGGPLNGLGEDSVRGGRGGTGFGGGRGGFGGGGGGGFGAGGAGGGAGAGGGGAAGAGGPGAGGLGAKGAGVGAGALAAEHAMGARGGAAGAAGAGRGGAAGGLGGMGAGGARGQGGEDDEHQRPSYLVEADPDEVFGTDEITAPPVIGG
ncbi:hypothetical protein [Actinokineospora spheciospongiae]|uniref:hypothetical protein n=1 Tax=Actinokineospora spheciospongiae TaxID=909613 RepID=UPI000D8B4F76|nr:hypothetical protein [Actinokineospora spheciospongiae]PWW50854.1 hypothetical protein DFQ13_1212 [Actinokineospora spheciospongiae]